MKVLKFGGSSVQTPERIRNVVKIVKADKQARVVVCSAFGGITDQLINTAKMAEKGDETYKNLFKEIEKRHIEAAKELIEIKRQSSVVAQVKNLLNELEELLEGIFLLRELSKRTLDNIVSFGERFSCYIISEYAKDAGLQAEYLDTRKVIRTNSNFTNAAVDFEITDKLIQEYIAQHPALQIATGFIGSNAEGVTTTLGRGGSDYTVSIFGAALQASEIEIWTDVDGVMTADPRKVAQAFPVPTLTYEEAMELSHFGAKVIYPPTMVPALKKNIPILIRNTFNPDFKGSIIYNQSSSDGKAVKGITSISNIALLRVQGSGMVGVAGVSARLFGALAKESISVILITQASSEHSICFAVKPEEAPLAVKLINEEFATEIQRSEIDKVVAEYDLSIVAIVGENMKKTSGVAGKMFQSLGKNGINITAIAQGSSELNISVVIKKEDEVKALRALHQAFFLSDIKVINVFIVGVGLIGSTLLKQIQEQKKYLLKEYSIDFKIIALANSKKKLFDANGIDLTVWKERLFNSPENMDMESFVREMEQLNLPNSVFIDNTASSLVSSFYERILKASISIVTPNKIASSGGYHQYQNLKDLAKKHDVVYLYETNVGAALPVISTLQDLVNSGDKILKIEAVLSGTLSYIFNTFDSTKKFSEVVKDAKLKGYTEPDPREDLSCSDVARKILILTRECGYPMESSDVVIHGFIPESCQKAPSVEEFFVELEKSDAYFEQMRANAEKEGKVLRCIAKFENGRADIALQAVGREHPFYQLSGSDNIIAFTTARYPERPLLVKGAGAGAEVTAAGVFADMIRIANYL
ncbi:bifunctional aspartate kinase/homoserine dehydrogenase I [Thermoflexibacter ruber]|uniref:Aspartate kinase n=1 Tax=Thermoflexibacter ruber TaxID=1003 RepID=A0A1I2I3D6_9BACT|nr:bifunctional aspartate kinase/homoserine dehydrogenase I [Thermoflexibacter ruber]SFF36168.1 aspartate kinase [Thermoflexibacter ruber]